MYGIAGFVEGFMGGVDKKNEWKDRKRDQKRQDKLDEMSSAEHERRMRILDQQIASTDKSVADQNFFEQSYQSAVDATKASMDGSAPAAPAAPGADLAATPGATSGLPPPSALLPLGIPTAESKGYGERGMPSVAELRDGNTPGTVNAPVVSSGPSFEAAGRSGPAPVVARGIPSTVQDPLAAAGVKRLPDGSLVAPAPSPAIADELHGQGPAGVRYLRTDEEIAARNKRLGVKSDAEIAAEKAQAEAQQQELNDIFLRVRADGGPLIPPDVRDAAREDLASRAPSALSLAPAPPTKAGADGIGKPPMEALSDTWQNATKPIRNYAPTGKAPATAAPEVRALSDTAAKAMAETTTPAMEATAAAAGRGLPEVKPGKTPSEETRTKYAASFMDHYREVGAPMVYEALVSKGEFEKAEAFRTFLDRDETKAGMDNWAKAAFAASVGDMDTFSEEIMEAYDRLDYFPDGTTIVREESGFTKDRDGNITGAKLTFKDAKTNNTWDQVFSDPNDLVRLGITLLAPEQAFEYYFQEQQAASEAARGIAKDQGAKDDKQQGRIDQVAELIFKNSVGLDGVPTMTYAEARAAAEAQLSGQAAGAAPMPPIARRP